MKMLWTWGGKFFGHREGDDLWTHDERHVGRFEGDEIYGPDGRYLGEIQSVDRLITSRSKAAWRKSRFSPYSRVVGYVPYVGYVGNVMYAGYQNFPGPKEI